MRIVIACDSFKGSCSAKQVAAACSRGIRKVDKDIIIDEIPLADGGEGTLQALMQAKQGILQSVKVHDPLHRIITAQYGVTKEQSVIIEMAQANGITLLKKEECNPLITSTYGCGELIRHALDQGYRKFLVGLGGSATNDAGVGMLVALGAVCYDRDNQVIPLGGEGLRQLDRIDFTAFDTRVYASEFIIANDVDNPLCGANGASAVFGPQKGAGKKEIALLDQALANYAAVISRTWKNTSCQVAGDGAAGGMGFTLRVIMHGICKQGIDVLIEQLGVEQKIQQADLIITGEGRLDEQTLCGKAPLGIAKLARKHHKKVIGISGGILIEPARLYEQGFTAVFAIVNQPMSLEQAMKNSEQYIEQVTESIVRMLV